MIKKYRIFILAFIGTLVISANSFAAQISITPELIISEAYTDNIFLDYIDELKVDDFITTAGLSLSLEILGQTAGFEANYTPSYSKFADNDDLDYWRHSARIRTWNDFSRNTRLQLTSTYLGTENPRDSSDETLVDGIATPRAIDVDRTRRTRDPTTRNANELRLSHQFGPRNTFYGAASYNFLKEDVPLEGIPVADYSEVRPSFGVGYWFNQQWGMVIDGSYSDRDYEDRIDRKEYFGSLRLLSAFSRRLSGYVQYTHNILEFDKENTDAVTTDEDYQIYSPSVGIEYQLRENNIVRIGAGYYIQDYAESDDRTRTIVDASINQKWQFRTGYVTLVAASGYDIEDRGAEELGLRIYYEGRLEAGHSFSSRFSGNIYTGYRHADYPDQVPDRTDQTIIAGAGISYQALRWMQLRLAYDYETINSDDETFEFTENSVIFTITMSPTSPYRLN